MGFEILYRSTRPASSTETAAIKRAVQEKVSGYTWLSCEPVNLMSEDDGRLSGGSKPNFEPDPADALAAEEGLPDGTTLELLDILCQLSRIYDIGWEISHDYSDGPLGYIQDGVCDSEVLSQLKALSNLGDALQNFAGEFEMPSGTPQSNSRTRRTNEDYGDDGPPILKFRPRGE
jgi:hypothetical protein